MSVAVRFQMDVARKVDPCIKELKIDGKDVARKLFDKNDNITFTSDSTSSIFRQAGDSEWVGGERGSSWGIPRRWLWWWECQDTPCTILRFSLPPTFACLDSLDLLEACHYILRGVSANSDVHVRNAGCMLGWVLGCAYQDIRKGVSGYSDGDPQGMHRNPLNAMEMHQDIR